MDLLELLKFLSIAGVALLAFLLLVLFIVQKVTTTPLPVIKRHETENCFLDPISITSHRFPTLEDKPTLDLSVIIPAYNEEKRLPVMLDECITYLEKKASQGNFQYEIILVSDGSTDGTVPLAIKYSKQHTVKKFRVLELVENRGKGGAVRLGMLSARGRYLLFADADGATNFNDYDKVEEGMKSLTSDWDEDAISIGSRAHLEREAIATRSFFRTFLMHGFHFLVWLFTVRSVRDTQCGFKLLTRASATRLFNIMHVERWAFDVELLFLAERFNTPISEVAVRWQEIEGSKITPFWSWLQMGRDVFLIWFRYTTGAWQWKDHEA